MVTAQEGEENFNLCLEYAESKIATHRNLSVNSHEIRRRINGLAERFTISNYPRYADRLKEMCNNLITDPLCTEHYETDVQWSILHFLLEMSKNPVTALAKNKDKIALEDVEDDDEANQRTERERCMADMINSLILINENANIPIQYEESDLSVRFFSFIFLHKFIVNKLPLYLIRCILFECYLLI